ncbi:MAG: preprotein translocase subunit YajC [Gammaproteobacteria bacterium]
MSLLINSAQAATATNGATTPGQSPLSSLVILGMFALVFYFMLWRPQNRRMKEHRQMLSNLAKGDEVITNGGVMGKIVKITDDFVVLNIAENVDIKVQKPAIANIVPKGTLQSA